VAISVGRRSRHETTTGNSRWQDSGKSCYAGRSWEKIERAKKGFAFPVSGPVTGWAGKKLDSDRLRWRAVQCSVNLTTQDGRQNRIILQAISAGIRILRIIWQSRIRYPIPQLNTESQITENAVLGKTIVSIKIGRSDVVDENPAFSVGKDGSP